MPYDISRSCHRASRYSAVSCSTRQRDVQCITMPCYLALRCMMQLCPMPFFASAPMATFTPAFEKGFSATSGEIAFHRTVSRMARGQQSPRQVTPKFCSRSDSQLCEIARARAARGQAQARSSVAHGPSPKTPGKGKIARGHGGKGKTHKGAWGTRTAARARSPWGPAGCRRLRPRPPAGPPPRCHGTIAEEAALGVCVCVCVRLPVVYFRVG